MERSRYRHQGGASLPASTTHERGHHITIFCYTARPCMARLRHATYGTLGRNGFCTELCSTPFALQDWCHCSRGPHCLTDLTSSSPSIALLCLTTSRHPILNEDYSQYIFVRSFLVTDCLPPVRVLLYASAPGSTIQTTASGATRLVALLTSSTVAASAIAARRRKLGDEIHGLLARVVRICDLDVLVGAPNFGSSQEAVADDTSDAGRSKHNCRWLKLAKFTPL